MRKVKLKTSRAGDGWTQAFGDEVEMPDDEAARMVAAELAEYVDEKPRKSEPVQDPDPETSDPEGQPPAPVEQPKPRRGRKPKSADAS